MGWLLVVLFLGPPPLNSVGEALGPSETLGILAVAYETEEKCLEALRDARIEGVHNPEIQGSLRQCLQYDTSINDGDADNAA